MRVTKKDYLEVAIHFETDTSYHYDRYEAFCVGYRIGEVTMIKEKVNCKFCLAKLEKNVKET